MHYWNIISNSAIMMLSVVISLFQLLFLHINVQFYQFQINQNSMMLLVNLSDKWKNLPCLIKLTNQLVWPYLTPCWPWLTLCSGSIGKRYARTDEIAIPYGITIDFHTLKISPSTVTLRDRDTTGQVRLPLSEVAEVIDQMCLGAITWNHVTQKYPNQDEWVAQNPIEE